MLRTDTASVADAPRIVESRERGGHIWLILEMEAAAFFRGGEGSRARRGRRSVRETPAGPLTTRLSLAIVHK